MSSLVGHGFRSRGIRLGVAALLLLAVGCGDNLKDEYRISAEAERSPAGTLDKLTVEGKGFSPNATVLMTLVLSASGGSDRPYVEEEIQTDGEGRFRYEKQPVPCPQPPDYQQGSYTLVVARDMSSGISGSEELQPGAEPDCRGSSGG